MTEKNYIYKKLPDGRYIKEIDDKVEHLASAQEDAKLATDIRSLLQGPQGESGTSGTSGQDGTSGRDGAEGRIGRTGLTGPRGQNGTSGSSGSSGANGTSGVDGQSGTSGVNGRKGDKGDKGDRGFPGLQGPAGQNGSAGVSGTSGTSATGGSTNDFQYRGLINNASGATVQTIVSNVQYGAMQAVQIQGGLPLMWPFRFETGFTYSAIQVEVVTLIAGSTFSFGIYSDNNNFPGSVLYRSPTILSSTTGIKQVVTSGSILGATKYWLVALTNGGNPTFRGLSIANNIGGLTSSTTGANHGFRTVGGGTLTTFTPSQLQFSTALPMYIAFII